MSWLTLLWTLKHGTLDIKLRTGSVSVADFGVIQDPAPNFWYTLCLAMETALKKVSLAVNGKILKNETEIQEVSQKQFVSLKNRLHIGVSYDIKKTPPVQQFYGQLSNMQIHYGGPQELSQILTDGCCKPGTFLDWQNMVWKTNRPKGSTIYVEENSICHPTDTYHLAFPSGVTQEAALKTCRKLGYGKMSTMSNDAELKAYIKWFLSMVSPGTCDNVWTPYSDAAFEGNFVNLNDGTSAEYLPWYKMQPNGGTGQNSVKAKLYYGLKSYGDSRSNNKYCFSCSLKHKTFVTWMGACSETYISDRKFFLATQGTWVEHRGLVSSTIR